MKLGNFFIEDLFELKKGKITNASELEENNEIPYIGAKYKNNGVIKFCKRVEEKVTRGNCIVFICDGEGSMGLSFYKASDFLGTVNIVAGYNKNLTPNIGIYISTVANTVRGKYNFGYKRTLERLKRETLQLPIDKNGDPDWDFMENYIAEKSNQIKATYELPKPHNITDHRELDEVEWEEYFIDDIIFVKSGVRLTKDNQYSGSIPFVGATDNNNGITEFINNTNSSTDKEVLGVNYNGSIGYAFYHPYTSTFSDDVKRLSFKENRNNQYTLLFLKHIIEKQAQKYAYGYKFNEKRMKRQIIKLPSKQENNKIIPDLDFMENYMKRLENKIIAEKLSTISS